MADDNGYLASGGPPVRLGDPPPGPTLGYVIPRRLRLEIDRGNGPLEQLPSSYDDARDGLWTTVRGDNPFDVLMLPESATSVDRAAINARGLLLANHWKAKLQIRRSGPGHTIEQKYGPEIEGYPDRVAWALGQLRLDGGVDYWRRDLQAKRLERAKAAMQEPMKLALADRTLTPEELELLFKYGTEAGYETEELAKVLLTELTALGLSPAQPPDGATDHARLTSGGTWAVAAPAPAVEPSLHSRAGRTASVVALALVAVIILIQLPFTMPNDFDRSIDAALKNNRLIDPPNQNAFDLWFDEACASGRTIRVLAAAERIRGKLAPLGEEAFRKWYEASDPSVNWREVARVYRRLGTLSPDRTEYPVRRTYAEGQLAFERRDYSAALRGFSKVLADSPPRVLGHMNALALNGIGRVYEARGENKAAELFYDSCIDTEPGFAWAFVNRAKQHMQSQEWDEADRLLIQALNDAPRASTILIALGQVCESRGNSPGALLRYEQALEIDRNPKLVQTVASLRGKLGK